MIFAEQIDAWIAVLRLQITSKAILTVINVHAPTLEKSDERSQFFESLKAVYKKYKADALVYIAGDFNGRVGVRRKKGNITC